MKVKRNIMPRVDKTPNKRARQDQQLTDLLAPLRNQISKLSKGQIRRNIKNSGLGSMSGASPSQPKK